MLSCFSVLLYALNQGGPPLRARRTPSEGLLMALTAETGRHPSTAEAMQDSTMDRTESAGPIPKSTERYTLKNSTHVPSISLANRGWDPMLAISGYLLNRRVNEKTTASAFGSREKTPSCKPNCKLSSHKLVGQSRA